MSDEKKAQIENTKKELLSVITKKMELLGELRRLRESVEKLERLVTAATPAVVNMPEDLRSG